MVVSELALYLHIPFCAARCRYCDFNTYAGLQGLIPAYGGALAREAALWGLALGRPKAGTVYFGGGTPSILPVADIRYLLDACRSAFSVAREAEVTLEANPGTVNTGYLGALRAAGVNRLSLGAQTFDQQLLSFLGRRHRAGQVREAVAAARGAGFDNVGLDLIYGLPAQSLEDWRADLEAALGLAPDHLSLYALEIGEATPLGKDLAAERCLLPDPDLAADMYLLAEETLARAGFGHYELSNWARPGRECRHNLVYWNNGPYLGLGAGAHSWLGGQRFAGMAHPRDYVRLVSAAPALSWASLPALLSAAPWVAQRESIGPALERAETVMLGLRLLDGLNLDEFQRRFGCGLAEAFPGLIPELGAAGLLEVDGGRLRLTPRGRLLGNQAFSRFLSPRAEDR